MPRKQAMRWVALAICVKISIPEKVGGYKKLELGDSSFGGSLLL